MAAAGVSTAIAQQFGVKGALEDYRRACEGRAASSASRGEVGLESALRSAIEGQLRAEHGDDWRKNLYQRAG